MTSNLISKSVEVFYSLMPSMQMVLRDGTYIAFVSNKFLTDKEEVATELKAEIAKGMRAIYQKGDGKEVVELDPLSGLKERLRAEIIAEEKARMFAVSGSTARDMGTTTSLPINPLSTADIAAGMADSTGDAVGSFLAVSTVNPAMAEALTSIASKASKK